MLYRYILEMQFDYGFILPFWIKKFVINEKF